MTNLAGRLALLALCATGFLLSCGQSSKTAVEVELRYSADWGLDEVRLSMDGNASVLDISERVRVVLPDSSAGKAHVLAVEGLAGNERLAYGEAEFEPQIGKTVSVSVVLSRLPCGAWCTAGTTRCMGDGVSTCQERAEDGCLVWSEATACGDDAPSCSVGECRVTCIDDCAAGETRCDGPDGVLECGQGDSDDCMDWLERSECGEGETCSAGACVTVCQDACTAGETACVGGGVQTCGDRDKNGCTEWGPTVPCNDGESCSGGQCSEVCSNDCETNTCSGLRYQDCGQYDDDECLDLSPGKSCVPADPCQEGLCSPEAGCESAERVCDDPPDPICLDETTLRTSTTVGECTVGKCEYPHEDTVCAKGCENNACKVDETDLCKAAAENPSHLGCEFWAVNLDSYVEVRATQEGECESGEPVERFVCTVGLLGVGPALCEADGSCPMSGNPCENRMVCAWDYKHVGFSIFVVNPQSFDVSVRLTNRAGDIAMAVVPPGQTYRFEPAKLGFPDQSIDRSSQAASAYRLSATAPIAAYQWNPLIEERAYGTDASLLLPRATFARRYVALTQPTSTSGFYHDSNGSVTVVAWQDNTVVRVTPSVATRSGVGIGVLRANVSRTFTLHAFDVLNLESGDGEDTRDLTGTVVEAVGEQTFGVFSGHEGPTIPGIENGCCWDHLEEMMLPTSRWGDTYAIVRSTPRGVNEADLIRIVAHEDGTQVTVSPATTTTCPTLAAGEYCDVEIRNNKVVTSNHPVLVGHYLLSVRTDENSAIGDPSMAMAVPISQFRTSYTFAVPAGFDENYVSVAMPIGGTVVLDGADRTSHMSTFGTGYSGGRFYLNPGSHTIECPGTCGIELHGYAEKTSYMLPGGMDLRPINP